MQFLGRQRDALIPVTPHTPIDSRWHRILLQSSIDGIAKMDLRAGAAQHPYTQQLLLASRGYDREIAAGLVTYD